MQLRASRSSSYAFFNTHRNGVSGLHRPLCVAGVSEVAGQWLKSGHVTTHRGLKCFRLHHPSCPVPGMVSLPWMHWRRAVLWLQLGGWPRAFCGELMSCWGSISHSINVAAFFLEGFWTKGRNIWGSSTSRCWKKCSQFHNWSDLLTLTTSPMGYT